MGVRCWIIVLLASNAAAFYLPGVAPRAYQKDEALALLVNRLDSSEAIVPYDYYYFDFCEPGEDANHPKEGVKVSENLGQILLGERIRTSPYKLAMRQDKSCVKLCSKTYDMNDVSSFAKFKKIERAIKLDYLHHWILDNLPAVECTSNCDSDSAGKPFYRLGFPVGCKIGESAESMTVCTYQNIEKMKLGALFLNNHIDIVISYHESEEFTGARIVGLEVTPRSINHASESEIDCGPDRDPIQYVLDATSPKLDIVYTYSVTFKPSDVKWASRWDTYLQSAEGTSIHWFSIVNSVIIVIFLSGMLGVILVRTVYRDIARYNQAEASEEAQEEFGWKLVHGDVFRAPSAIMLLSVVIGSGTQLLSTFVITLIFACLGFLSPATRGGMMTSMLVLWVMLGILAGYVSARLYKMFGGEQWKTNVLLASFLVPGIIFIIFFVLNLILWHMQSSAAVPFGTLLALVTLWFCVSVPLTFLGAYFGFKKAAFENPVRTNQIPRQIPPQQFYTKRLPCILMGGILPFGCIFIQLFFILNSIWGHKLYYVFGFLFVVFIILAITTAESVMLLCYFHLCAEDYHWWWRAFLTGASSSIYLFLYAVVFYFKRMEVDGTVNFVLYAGYTLIATFLFGLATGTIGFYGCFAFVRKIYSVVKID